MNHYFDINGYCLRCGQHAYKTTPTCMYNPLTAYLKREYEKQYGGSLHKL